MKKSLLALIAAVSFFGAANAAQAGGVHFSINTYAPPQQRYIVTDYWRGTGYYAPVYQPVYVTHVPRHYVVKQHPRHRDRHHHRPHRGW